MENINSDNFIRTKNEFYEKPISLWMKKCMICDIMKRIEKFPDKRSFGGGHIKRSYCRQCMNFHNLFLTDDPENVISGKNDFIKDIENLNDVIKTGLSAGINQDEKIVKLYYMQQKLIAKDYKK
jgi:hypothetical protein